MVIIMSHTMDMFNSINPVITAQIIANCEVKSLENGIPYFVLNDVE